MTNSYTTSGDLTVEVRARLSVLYQIQKRLEFPRLEVRVVEFVEFHKSSPGLR